MRMQDSNLFALNECKQLCSAVGIRETSFFWWCKRRDSLQQFGDHHQICWQNEQNQCILRIWRHALGETQCGLYWRCTSNAWENRCVYHMIYRNAFASKTLPESQNLALYTRWFKEQNEFRIHGPSLLHRNTSRSILPFSLNFLSWRMKSQRFRGLEGNQFRCQ